MTPIRAATTGWLTDLSSCKRVTERSVKVLDVLDDIYNEKRDAEIYGIRAALIKMPVVV